MAANPSSESGIGGASPNSVPRLVTNDHYIEWIKAHYKPHDFLPQNPLVINIVVRAPEDTATFYLATLTYNRKLGVKFSRLDLPLWHSVSGSGAMRYLCADGKVIVKNANYYYEEREDGYHEISFTTAEEYIQRDLEAKFLYKYLRGIAYSLPQLSTCY